MGPRRIIVLLIAVIAAGGTAMYARSWVAHQQTTSVAAPAPKSEIHEVLVADTDLAAGIFIKPQHLRWQRWPTDDVPDSYVLRGKRTDTDMVGAVVRSFIAAGEPITDGAVVKPGDRGFLAAVLDPGMRAVSVPVNPTSSNAGLIFPGDRIDLILTQTLTSGERQHAPGQRDRAQGHPDHRHGRCDQRSGRGRARANEKAKTATFEVTPQQAEIGGSVDRARQAVAEPAQPGGRSGGGPRPAGQGRQHDLGQGRLARPPDRSAVVAPARAARQQHRRRQRSSRDPSK